MESSYGVLEQNLSIIEITVRIGTSRSCGNKTMTLIIEAAREGFNLEFYQ